MLSVQQHYLVGEQHQFVGNPLSSAVGRGNVIVQNEHSSDSNSSSCNDSVKDSTIGMSSAQKRKLYGSSLPQQQSSVARRNARERNRVKQVNNGFATLRQHIPDTLASYYASSANAGNNGGGNGSGSSSASGSKSNSKKLSKVEILRIALKYIETMKSLIDEHDAEILSSPSSSPSPNNLLQTLDCAGMNMDMNYELKSESDEESYAPVPNHYEHQYVHQDQYQMIQQQPQQLQQQQVQQQQQQQVTYINSNSPTPSFTSEASSTWKPRLWPGWWQLSHHEFLESADSGVVRLCATDEQRGEGSPSLHQSVAERQSASSTAAARVESGGCSGAPSRASDTKDDLQQTDSTHEINLSSTRVGYHNQSWARRLRQTNFHVLSEDRSVKTCASQLVDAFCNRMFHVFAGDIQSRGNDIKDDVH
ncbi:unnamed protein product [Trichogramma brassicae]|uniref:BHLH domain-containing protein n=1 Tax=Trichogramma brassicae TaxID=86971 RepID=A0A6H5I6L5_9HYME|nr:unnamed protein product [Trichogramma brassicae]